MDFKERLFELRRQAGLSQEELAHLLGLTRQAVQKWEAGTSRPDMDNLAALADYFHVSLDYLTGREGACPPPPPEQEYVPPAPTIIHHHYHEGWHYEYKSERTLFGLPLVHINLGRGNHWARGIVAIGNIATGFVALGGIAAGLLSLGAVSFGLLLALGAVARRRRRGGGLPGGGGLRGLRAPGHRAACGRSNRHPRPHGGAVGRGGDGGPRRHHRGLPGRPLLCHPVPEILRVGGAALTLSGRSEPRSAGIFLLKLNL